MSRLDTNPFNVVVDQVLSETEAMVNDRRTILAGTNNYLGLTFDPRCIAAGRKALEEQGTGTTGSRMANGTYAGHLALEKELADFFGVPSAIVFFNRVHRQSRDFINASWPPRCHYAGCR